VSEKIPLIYKKMTEVMANIGAVGKDRKNELQGYKFRGIEDIYNAAHPALIKAGVFCVPQVIEYESSDRITKNGGTSIRVVMKVCHRFFAEDGSYVDAITVGEGMDTSDKASNKAMSAAMKYAFVESLSLPFAEVDDGDKDHPEAGFRQNGKAVERTTEPIPVKKLTEAVGQALAAANATITPDQAKKLHMRFRESLSEELKKNADVILHDWLRRDGYINEKKEGTALAIPTALFAKVGKAAVAYAGELSRNPAQSDDEPGYAGEEFRA
jgi:hypothetical protein